MPETILVVDDDPVQRRLLEGMIRGFGYEAITAASGDAALGRLLGAGATPADAVVLDLVMPDLDGLGVLARLNEAGLTVPVIVQTAHGGVDNVISAMRAGATDFVVKPVGPERLQVSLRNALAANALEIEFKRLKHNRGAKRRFKDAITRSLCMQATLPRLSPDPGVGTLPIFDAGGDIRPLVDIEAELIRVAIAHYDGQMSKVARKLRIGRSTLYRRLRDLTLEAEHVREISCSGVAAE